MLHRLPFKNGQGVVRVSQGFDSPCSVFCIYVSMNCWRSISRRRATRRTSSSLNVGCAFATTIGAGGAVNSSPYTFGNLGDAVVNIVRVQIRSLEKLAEPPVLLFLFRGQLADLNEIDLFHVTLFFTIHNWQVKCHHTRGTYMWNCLRDTAFGGL